MHGLMESRATNVPQVDVGSAPQPLRGRREGGGDRTGSASSVRGEGLRPDVTLLFRNRLKLK